MLYCFQIGHLCGCILLFWTFFATGHLAPNRCTELNRSHSQIPRWARYSCLSIFLGIVTHEDFKGVWRQQSIKPIEIQQLLGVWIQMQFELTFTFYLFFYSKCTCCIWPHGSETLLGCWDCVAQWLLPFSKCGPACSPPLGLCPGIFSSAPKNLLHTSGAPFMWDFSLSELPGWCYQETWIVITVWTFTCQHVSDTELYFAFQPSIPEVLSASQMFAAGRAAIFCGCVWCRKMEMLLKWKQLVTTALSAGEGRILATWPFEVWTQK